MSNLEADLRAAAKNGFLDLSLHRRPSGVWEAAYRYTDTTEVFRHEADDIVEAMVKAVRSGTRASKAASRPKPKRDIEDLA